MSKQVKCIKKRGNHYDPHERIEGIGGVDGGTRWYRAEDAAIRDVEADSHAYYVSENGRSVWVIIAKHNGRKYLKTETDHYLWDNLLALPECP